MGLAMQIMPRGVAIATLATVVLTLLLAGSARAACPIDNPTCGGGGETTTTWTNTLTVSRTTGTVTSDVTGVNGINCGSDCSGRSQQVTGCFGGDCLDPDPDGWATFLLTATGGPSGFSPDWTGCDSISSGTCHVYLDRNRTVTLGWVDTTDPVVNTMWVGTAGGKVGARASVSATASDNDAVAKVEWFVDSSPTPVAIDTTAPYSGTIDLSAYPEGAHTILARAIDASGRASMLKTVGFTLDKHVNLSLGSIAVPPDALAGFTNAVAVPLTVSTDDDAATSCGVAGALTVAPAPCAGSFSPVTASSPDGTYTYTVRATDAVGNTASGSREFVLDRTEPAISNFDGPTEGSQVSTSAVTMTFTVTDTNLQWVDGTLDGNATPCTTSATLSNLSDGIHGFTVTGTDKAGNSSSKTRTFSVKLPAPDSVTGGGTPSGPAGGTPSGPTGGTPSGPTGGTPEPALKRNPARLVYRYSLKGGITRLSVLKAKHVAKGSAIKVQCRGGRRRGCPKKKTLVIRRKQGTVGLKALQGRRFRAGTVLTITISRPGMKTKLVKIKIRKHARPKVS